MISFFPTNISNKFLRILQWIFEIWGAKGMKSVRMINIFKMLPKGILPVFFATHKICVFPFHHNTYIINPVLVSTFPVISLKSLLFIHIYWVLPICWAHSFTKGSGDCLEKAKFAQRMQDAGEPRLQVQNWYSEQQDSMEKLEVWG